MKNIIILLVCFLTISCKAQNDKTMKDPYQKPQIIGGIDSLKEEIQNQLFIESCNSGKVYVQIKINQKGDFVSAEIAKGLCKEADSIALELVKTIRYIPATKNGIPYESNLIIPFDFKSERN